MDNNLVDFGSKLHNLQQHLPELSDRRTQGRVLLENVDVRPHATRQLKSISAVNGEDLKVAIDVVELQAMMSMFIT